MRNGFREQAQRFTLDGPQQLSGRRRRPGDVVAAVTHPSSVVESGSPLVWSTS